MRGNSLLAGVTVPVALLIVASSGAQTAQASLLSPRTAVVAPPGIPAEVLAPAGSEAGSSAQSIPTSFTGSLNSALGAAPLGSDVTGQVTDAATGAVLYSKSSNRPQHPASTIKILTAMAILKALGPDARLSTNVTFDSVSDQVVLHGAGDSTLARVRSEASSWPTGQSARPATLSDLAVRTAAALHKAGATNIHLALDDSLFVGSSLAPGWKPSYVTAGVVSPVMALSADGGRVSASSNVRSEDPAKVAADYFAGRLRALGIKVAPIITRVANPVDSAGESPTKPVTNTPTPMSTSVASAIAAPASAGAVSSGPSVPALMSPGDGSQAPAAAGPTVIASVQSPSIADLVERMLTRSDDDLAEALGHLAGGKLVGSASFEGGVRATKDTLEQSGLSMKGMRLADASGLSSLNELDSATFTHALSVVVANKPFTGSSVGTLWPVSSGLPIAGLTGTLSDRFTSAKTIRGRGVVRAKTGTLTGVIGLAGIVRDSHGRILIFDFDADHAPGPIADARAAVDRVATIVATS